jgi:hypothetical protein
MVPQAKNILSAFLAGLTGAGLFRRLDYPGASTEFVDSRSLEEIRASGEIEHNTSTYKQAKRTKLDDVSRRRTSDQIKATQWR